MMILPYNHRAALKDRLNFLTQSNPSLTPTLTPAILASWKRSKAFGIDPALPTLPALTPTEIATGKSKVSGYTYHIRRSSPSYYKEMQNILAMIGACLCYVSEDFYIYGRYGNQNLKDELKTLNIALGTSLAESRIGTNAVSLAAISQKETWVIGTEHYAHALQNYACFAFPSHASYNKKFYIMLTIPFAKFTPLVSQFFSFIKSTELIVSSGLTTSDMYIKNLLLDLEMDKNGTLLIVINGDGIIINVNNLFLQVFHTSISATIGSPLVTVLPELKFILDCFETGRFINMQEKFFQRLPERENLYYINSTLMKENDKWLGMAITLTKGEKIQGIVHQVANLKARFTFSDLWGNSAIFKKTKALALKTANSASTVLILGESGTGKELFAHSIHNESPRKDSPFIAVNCAAIPRELIGSELFGYVRGAFTGANKDGAQGKFELANGGTLFLDEIAEMPLDMQTILLRVLEERIITRLGGNKNIKVDVRVIAATNKNLSDLVAQGKFRLDLYYRLNVIILNLPSLRERLEDIAILVTPFLDKFSQCTQKQVYTISDEALKALQSYAWPGNIRELRNVIERGVNLASGNELTLADLPAEITAKPNIKSAFTETPLIANHFSKLKQELIKQLMEKHKGNKSLVAAELGIARTTLYRALKNL